MTPAAKWSPEEQDRPLPDFSEVILKAIVDTALFILGYVIQKRYVF